MTEPATFSVALANETATAQLMADLALLTGPGDVITLSGEIMPIGTMCSASTMTVSAAIAITGLKLRAVSAYVRLPR